MDEADLIRSTERPATTASLLADLRELGVAAGDVLIVHTSLRSMGWVAGGAAAVVDALLAAVGADGTVTMPAHSGDWSDPSGWANPPVPEDWWVPIVEGRPAFDPYGTPLRQMGAVAENLLLRRATLRSGHPLHSHMAHGPHAAAIVADHPLEDSFGDRSPIGRLYDLDATVLLIGVGHANNTSLHLAESRAAWPGKPTVTQRSTVTIEDVSRVVTWHALDPDADDFDDVGAVLDDSGIVRFGTIGQSTVRIARQRDLVDRAVAWFEAHRPFDVGGP
jgi:aminoglycoside 3-N-acetyltransferase